MARVEQIWDPELEQYVDHVVEEKPRRGRPQVPTVQSKWQKFMEKGEKVKLEPQFINVDEIKDLDLKKIASITNFINNFGIDDTARVAARLRNLNLDMIQSDRTSYGHYIQFLRDDLSKLYYKKWRKWGKSWDHQFLVH